MKILVDEGKCIGAGNCVLAAPALFDQRDSDGIVILLNPDPDENEGDHARNAARHCPSGAIRITESD